MCSYGGHSEIVYEGSICPVCKLIERVNDLETFLEKEEDKSYELSTELSYFKHQASILAPELLL